ncbi:MAG: patatin-like phospholipase family protein [Gammaproteobacteria bacterium]|nr:patatin-like phospholipase family protein [Gammaproteobacteria bacterium]MCP5318232.1 patatin-like phospholipase family protein [Chromatiaceae bacterium]MCW5587302.1 patatin-like phospholipase family protein [Chromatiales bacterium]MCB1819458.1 patatin-like phospholipase family protein [Gammaproteobacteria bacterium]MCP5435025.1 patatin-like phospholipase family protein [Chromatiaceae bacterium]
MTPSSDKTISLVLGSGGARGLAHIGVIRVLERHGWKIGAISGSSIGALIGGFYAAGKLDEYAEWVQELTEFNVLRYLDVAWGGAGMLKGEMLMQTLQHFVGTHRIEDLPIPLSIVATDVLTRKEVWLRRGDLFDAIRASIAVPTVFTPHMIKGRPLLDGGILNPVPIAPTLQDPTDAIIAVSLSGVPKRVGGSSRHDAVRKTIEKPRHRYQKKIEAFIDQLQERLGLHEEDATDRPNLSLTDAALLSLDAMQSSIARCMLAAYPPDVLIEIPIDTCAAHEFYRAAEVIEAGEYWAEKEIERLDHRHD